MPDRDFNAMPKNAKDYAREIQRMANKQSSFEENKNNNKQSSKQYGETPFCSNACPVKNILGYSKSNEADNDILTLMAILLLLASDGGDKLLMLALLYIMT